MTLRDVPRSEWRSFLEGFSREHRGWIATINGVVGGAPVTDVESAKFECATLESSASGSLVRITFINGISLCAPEPCGMRVQMDDGAERALEVETDDGGFIRLAFRATALPEQLDGLAPGEMMPEPSHNTRR